MRVAMELSRIVLNDIYAEQVLLLKDSLPYLQGRASLSLLYVAFADLIPQLQKRLTARETGAQIAWLLTGIALVAFVSGLAHSH